MDDPIDRALKCDTVSKACDELLDHIYEYGTSAEGVGRRIDALCIAAIRAAIGDPDRYRAIAYCGMCPYNDDPKPSEAQPKPVADRLRWPHDSEGTPT